MKKKNRKTTEVSYWESMADSMVALLLCILLIMLLLMLFLVRIEDNRMVDDELGIDYGGYTDPDAGGGNRDNGRIDDEDGDSYTTENEDGGGGGGEEGGGEDDADEEFEDPDPGAGEGDGSDRAAVFVQVMDGETNRTIKKEGITFELYSRNAALQVLNTYYPKKISYKQYKTDNQGVFFLPERIRLGDYYLRCLTAVTGYDTGKDTYFLIDQSYEWEDPYVLNVKLYPSKSVIEVHYKDETDGKALSDGEFQVVAAENITTADGTLRYREGSVVDSVQIGSDGVGQSKELYLGSYLLRQSAVPTYYGKTEREQSVTLKPRTAAKRQESVEILGAKTTLTLTATDELYESSPLADVRFTLRESNGSIVGRLTTNEQGRFTVSNLKKNTMYSIRQESELPGYTRYGTDLTFRVDGDGYINGTTNAEMKVTNRTLRLSVGVQDQLFRGLVSDVNLALMDADGNVVKNWSSSGMEQTIEGLAPGEYKLIVGGNQEKAASIIVENIPEIQQVRLSRWTTADIAGLTAGVAVIIGLIVVLMKLRSNKKQKGERT